MTIKRPAFQFYPGDWRRDAGLQSCSLTARGLWIEMLCIMHDSKPYGHLRVGEKVINDSLLARMSGGTPDEVTVALKELEDAGVFSRTKDGAIYSRRLVADNKKSQAGRRYGLKGGNPRLVNPPIDDPLTDPLNHLVA